MNSDSSCGSPSSSSMPITSARFRCNSSSVSPCEWAPGKPGNVANKQARVRTALNHGRKSLHGHLQNALGAHLTYSHRTSLGALERRAHIVIVTWWALDCRGLLGGPASAKSRTHLGIEKYRQ